MAYSPASETVASGLLVQTLATYYRKKEVPNFKATTPFLSMAKREPLPMHAGNQIQFFTYPLLSANTNQQAEGTVGTPIIESSTKIVATIGQYCDFINSSDLALETSYEEGGLLGNLSTELHYRLALTINTIVQTAFDTANAVDSSVRTDLAVNSFLTANNIRTQAQSLLAANVRPLTGDGYFGAVIHPNVMRDVLNDTSANGITDVMKRHKDGVNMLQGPLDSNDVLEWAGVRFKQSTTAPTATVNSQTYYTTYIVGEDALFAISLGKALSDKGDNYKMNVQFAPENGTVSDPARVIGGWVSYNTKFTTTLRPGTTMALRIVRAMTSAS